MNEMLIDSPQGEKMSWTDDRVELLKKLWTEGLSASQIAGRLGCGVTRNAVIGKVHRFNLSGRAPQPRTTPSPRRARSASRAIRPRSPASLPCRVPANNALEPMMRPEPMAGN